MSTYYFSIKEHIVPCQYIREYPHATRSDHAHLKIAIKEYRPIDGSSVEPLAATIIFAPGNGLPKETYEPLFDDLYCAAQRQIRSLWVADPSHQGASGVLNEEIQGDDPCWFDHSRDLLCAINHFQSQMARPMIGVAHSMGCAQLVHLSLLHPRLFHSLALIEPVIQPKSPVGSNPALPSTFRSDLWPSRAIAEASLRRNPMFKTWEPRVVGNYLRYGLRETPTKLYPASQMKTTDETPVTLTTTKHQEAWTFVRSNFVDMPDKDTAHFVSSKMDHDAAERLFYCADTVMTFQNLQHVRPNLLWIFGTSSYLNASAKEQDEKLTRSGIGLGGSGGSKLGRVEKITIEGGHMLPFEKVEECSCALAAWLKRQIEDFGKTEEFWRMFRSGRSDRAMTMVSKQWMDNVKLGLEARRGDQPKI